VLSAVQITMKLGRALTDIMCVDSRQPYFEAIFIKNISNVRQMSLVVTLENLHSKMNISV